MNLSRAIIVSLAALGLSAATGCSGMSASAATLSAHTSAAPALRQVSVKTQMRYGLLWTVRVVVARSDHKSPQGLRVCVEQREGRRVFSLACGPLDSHGAYVARLYQANSATLAHSHTQFVLRAHHLAGGGFKDWAGAWTNQ